MLVIKHSSSSIGDWVRLGLAWRWGGHAARPSNRRAAGTSTRETWRGEGVYSAREVVQVCHTSTAAIVRAKYMWFSFMVVIITLLLPRAAQRARPGLPRLGTCQQRAVPGSAVPARSTH